MLMRNTMHHLGAGLNIETACCAYSDSTNIRACFFARRRDLGAHQVARLKTLDGLLARQIAPRKAELVEARALIAAAAGTLNDQRR